VRDCAVIGLADEDWGECVCAVIKPDGVISDRELSDHCRRFLAGYKTPKHWFRVEDLPLNAAGKVDKPLLRRHYGAQSSQYTPEKAGASFSDEY
jgi:acyl-CoA synthetase (AMP-forming)/AMP-acid ligase II